MDEYAKLTERLAAKIASKEREGVSSAISRIKFRANAALASIEASLTASSSRLRPKTDDDADPSPASQVYCNERYLGEVSDVQFFNLVKRVLQTQNDSPGEEHQLESYEQDDHAVSANAASCRTIELPSPDSIKSLTDVFLSTIHLAYPFIPGTMFTDYLNGLSKQHGPPPLNDTKLALLCT